jgi:hypothetical protein
VQRAQHRRRLRRGVGRPGVSVWHQWRVGGGDGVCGEGAWTIARVT